MRVKPLIETADTIMQTEFEGSDRGLAAMLLTEATIQGQRNHEAFYSILGLLRSTGLAGPDEPAFVEAIEASAAQAIQKAAMQLWILEDAGALNPDLVQRVEREALRICLEDGADEEGEDSDQATLVRTTRTLGRCYIGGRREPTSAEFDAIIRGAAESVSVVMMKMAMATGLEFSEATDEKLCDLWESHIDDWTGRVTRYHADLHAELDL